MKKLPVMLAAASFAIVSVSAFADKSSIYTHNDASPFAVSIPHLRSGFEVSLEGLFLQPSSSDLGYGFIVNNETADVLHNDNSSESIWSQNYLLAVNPHTDVGYAIGVGYVFPNSGNDLQLHWSEFSHTYTRTDEVEPAPIEVHYGDIHNGVDIKHISYLQTPYGSQLHPSVSINAPINNGNTVYVVGAGRAKFKLDMLDLDAGHYFDVGDRLRLRPFAGLRYSHVESNLNGYYNSNDVTDGTYNYTQSDDFNAGFNGLGPLLGADANYNFNSGIGLSAQLATALLVGNVHTDTHYMSVGNSIVLDNNDVGIFEGNTQLSSNNVTRIVPAFNAKLGVNYSYTFDCSSILTLEGGYKATEYLNAVDRARGVISQTGADPASIAFTTSSVSFSGPYVKVSLKL